MLVSRTANIMAKATKNLALYPTINPHHCPHLTQVEVKGMGVWYICENDIRGKTKYKKKFLNSHDLFPRGCLRQGRGKEG